MPRKKKKDPAAIATLEATEPTPIAEVLAKSPIAEMVAEQGAKAADQEAKAPTFESFQASREAKAQIDPERALPEPDGEEAVAAFKRQRERELGVAELPPPEKEVIPTGPRGPRISPEEPTREDEPPAGQDTERRSHVQRLSEPRGLRPTPKGFMGLEGHYDAGIRLSRSLDKNVAGIQFADDQKPTRDGENSEKEQLESLGFLYVPKRSQWERVDREQPGENYQDAKVLVESLVKARLSKAAAGFER